MQKNSEAFIEKHFKMTLQNDTKVKLQRALHLFNPQHEIEIQFVQLFQKDES